MSILPPSATKHDLDGIGGASSKLVMALLASQGATFLTAGFVGRIVDYVLTKFFSWMASMGLVILNVGAEKISTAVLKAKFDGSMESAERLIAEIQGLGRTLTPEETVAIDGPVIDAFRKFGKIARKKK